MEIWDVGGVKKVEMMMNMMVIIINGLDQTAQSMKE